MRSALLRTASLIALAASAAAADPAAAEFTAAVVAQAGGEEQLLRVFRFREQVLITATPTPPPAADAPGNRTSVVEVGGRWWLGTKKRDKDKVRVLLWAWSLRILLDPESQIARLADATIGDTSVVGLRVTGSIEHPIDLWFDAATKRLVAVDYTDTRHKFSDWKTTVEGYNYPAHVAGYRFADAAAKTTREQQWYQTDLLEVTPLAEFPEGLDP